MVRTDYTVLSKAKLSCRMPCSLPPPPPSLSSNSELIERYRRQCRGSRLLLTIGFERMCAAELLVGTDWPFPYLLGGFRTRRTASSLLQQLTMRQRLQAIVSSLASSCSSSGLPSLCCSSSTNARALDHSSFSILRPAGSFALAFSQLTSNGPPATTSLSSEPAARPLLASLSVPGAMRPASSRA
jgi:hypothetical protein